MQSRRTRLFPPMRYGYCPAEQMYRPVQVVPPPMKSQSTVGAGDSMVGAMTLRLAENASLEDMVRFGVAAGSAATINQGTRLCSLDNTQKIYNYLRG